MVSEHKGGIGIERIETLAAAGYDYVELPLAQMMELNDEEFDLLVEKVSKSGIPCEVCNNFFPPTVRLTGNDVNIRLVEEYIDRALGRAQKLGAKVIVFGSSGAKNVPEGFEYKKAWEQIVDVLRIIDEKIGKRDINIAIEPLCKLESNIVNTAHQGWMLAKQVSRRHIRLLIDFYHLSIENEEQSIINEVSGYLQHIHIANPKGRVFPKPDDGVDYQTFLNNLKPAGYDSRVSIEAYTENFLQAAPDALSTIREASQ
jgi:D-psicose/D-tagatose/L-ribulose 3-epimerase